MNNKANNGANMNADTEPKPTHSAGVMNHPTADIPKPDGTKVFGEIGRGTSSVIQAGAIVPLTSLIGATEAAYFVNRHALDKIDFLLSDLDRFTKREPRNKQDAIYMRGMFRGAFRNDLLSLRNMLSKTDVCVGQVMLDDIAARMKRNAATHGEKIEPNEGV